MSSGDAFSTPGFNGKWSVRFEPSFEVDRVRVEADARRFDELCESLTWLMENQPDSDEDCPVVPGTPFRIARAVDPDGGLIRVLFTIRGPGEVSAWRVDRVAPDNEDEESAEDST
jgi:hypothetical protein